MTDPKTLDTTVTSASVPPMSEQAFSAWGVEHVAYVKPLIVSERPVYAIHAAKWPWSRPSSWPPRRSCRTTCSRSAFT